MMLNFTFILLTFLLFVLYGTIKTVDFKLLHIFFIAFIVRIAILIIDYYKIIPLLHSGSDTEVFHKIAKENLDATQQNKIILTNYVSFLTIVYYVFDSSRFIAQYINVLFSYFAMLYLYKTATLITNNRRTIKTILWVWAIFPDVVILAGILLRESLCHFFITISLYYFVSWFKSGKYKYIILSSISVFVASYLHSGCISILLGYMIAFISYKRNDNKMKISLNSFPYLVLTFCIILIYIANIDIFGKYFEKTINSDNILESTRAWGSGRSDYLISFKDVNMMTQLLISPIKILYFLLSPMPWNFRGINDIISFTIESTIIGVLCYKAYKKKVAKKDALLKRYLMLSFLLITFVFSMGTTNTGTAMRHRIKCFPALLVWYVVPKEKRTVFNVSSL